MSNLSELKEWSGGDKSDEDRCLCVISITPHEVVVNATIMAASRLTTSIEQNMRKLHRAIYNQLSQVAH